MQADTRTYKDAIQSLNSLQTNLAAIAAYVNSDSSRPTIDLNDFRKHCNRIGYEINQFDKLNVIHISGTKGKGSTGAFVESILRNYQPTSVTGPITPLKSKIRTGLYTSPHIVAVRERIRINGKALSENQFTKYFFECWDHLNAASKKENKDFNMPPYFRFLTLVALHTFMEEKVDVAIIEVGIGGEYDCTNIIQHPVVCGVSSLGYDHMSLLGDTLSSIAWHKGGIFKHKIPAISIEQPKEALEVLIQRAKDKEAPFTLVKPIDSGALDGVKLGLDGSHQFFNASLAIELSRTWLQNHRGMKISPQRLPPEFKIGLSQTRLSGRAEIIQSQQIERLTWYFDGAHTVESLQLCMNWFRGAAFSDNHNSDSMASKVKRILIFNVTGNRNGTDFLSQIVSSNPYIRFDHAIFCTNITYSNKQYKSDLQNNKTPDNGLIQQKSLAETWSSLIAEHEGDHDIAFISQQRIQVYPTIQDAINWITDYVAKSIDKTYNVQVLVTGSLHLVGGVMEVLNVEIY
ncbi:hypothetical protein G9A89_017189 [Geosiphon pyriformis]|nr:hypothetical protein G9A89_017189 [Geosiphon pyriformis]